MVQRRLDIGASITQWRQRQRQQQQQWRRRGDGGGGCGGYCGSGHSSAVLGSTPCVPWAAVEAPAAGPSLPVTLSATSSASCPPGAASPHSRRVQATALLLRFRCACRYIMCRRVARTGRTEYTVTGSVRLNTGGLHFKRCGRGACGPPPAWGKPMYYNIILWRCLSQTSFAPPGSWRPASNSS